MQGLGVVAEQVVLVTSREQKWHDPGEIQEHQWVQHKI